MRLLILHRGIVTACTAAVSNVGGLYTCRFLLGLVGTKFASFRNLSLILSQTEAGMFPGIILQLSYWYRPDEIAVRLIWICTSLDPRYSCCDVNILKMLWAMSLVSLAVSSLTASMLLRELEDSLAGSGKRISTLLAWYSNKLTGSRRLFAVEGIITVLLSVIVFFYLPDCKYQNQPAPYVLSG
jgi:hypothetical protein